MPLVRVLPPAQSSSFLGRGLYHAIDVVCCEPANGPACFAGVTSTRRQSGRGLCLCASSA
ncbi:hypothetical protein T492DRAFT_896954 [Pavlovales sp. CCMP2436]|nr:hypothetical protein T492DRAFT_896954 [Pavlovales sp. CCMP2436]